MIPKEEAMRRVSLYSEVALDKLVHYLSIDECKSLEYEVHSTLGYTPLPWTEPQVLISAMKWIGPCIMDAVAERKYGTPLSIRKHEIMAMWLDILEMPLPNKPLCLAYGVLQLTMTRRFTHVAREQFFKMMTTPERKQEIIKNPPMELLLNSSRVRHLGGFVPAI